MRRKSFYILSCGFTLSTLNFKFSSTFVESALQINLFMQNKAKLRKSQMNVNKALTKDYEKKTLGQRGKKQSQTNPNKAKSKKAEMNVTSILTVGYENKSPIRAPKKQSQTSKRQKPMQTSLLKGIMKKPPLRAPKKQTQYKPKQTQSNAISKAKKCCRQVNPHAGRRTGTVAKIKIVTVSLTLLCIDGTLSPLKLKEADLWNYPCQ